MYAKDSVSNFSEQLKKYTAYVEEQIRTVIGTVGPRESGEVSERKAQDYMVEHMTGTADTVEREGFKLHPKAFMGWVLIDGICMLAAAILMLLSFFSVSGFGTWAVVVALILTLVSVVCILGEFLFYKELLDPLFPERESSNVICTRKAAGETKRRIILSGHIDSAYEWRYTFLGGGRCLTAVIVAGIVCLIADLVIAILMLAIPGIAEITALKVLVLIFLFLSLPVMVLIINFVNWKLVVPGANDNLTGIFASMAVMQYLVDNDIRFENTEVVSISMACEEAGLRGAKAFAAAHAKEFEDSGVETITICTDTLRDFDDMGIYNKDMSGTVKLDPKVAGLVREASKTAGLDLPYANVFFGSSDAAALAQGGMKACCLAAMDPTPARYYHTRLDTEDNLDPKTIEAGISTLLEAVYLFDEKGLDYEEA